MNESLAEQFLKEKRQIRRSSLQRQRVLGCIGCRWSKAEASGEEPTIYGYQVTTCIGIKSGALTSILQSLEDAGVVSSYYEDMDPDDRGRPRRRYFTPADSKLGQEFATILPPVDDCPLDDSTDTESPIPTDQPELF